MTPKEKAAAIVGKYEILIEFDFVSVSEWHKLNEFDYNKRLKKDAIKCSLAAVDEILNANQIWYEDSIPYKYWNEVKNEINKLQP